MSSLTIILSYYIILWLQSFIRPGTFKNQKFSEMFSVMVRKHFSLTFRSMAIEYLPYSRQKSVLEL
jgi:hypothetical protein